MLVPMKKATLVILKQDREAMLKSLQRGAHIMLVSPDAGTKTENNLLKREEESVDLQQSEAMLQLVNTYSEKQGFFAERPQVSYQKFLESNPEGAAVVAEISKISEQMNAHQTKVAALEAENDQLRPWAGLGAPTAALSDTKSVRIVPGFVPSNVLDDVKAYITEQGQELEVLGEGPEGIAVIAYLYRPKAETYLSALKDTGFTETTLVSTTAAPDVQINHNLEEIEAQRAEIHEEEEKLKTLSAKKDQIELLIQQEISQKERSEAPYTNTSETVMLQGWVRSDRVKEFTEDVKRVTDVYDLRLTDPPEGETPPTVTKNSHFLAQFETITESFSLPKAGSLDPAPVAGPWYWLIYGMMIGDAGYGVVMAVALYLFKKFKKPTGSMGKLVNVLFYCSFTTIFWGVIFGSYFGETWHPILFNPLEAPMAMLIFSLFIGVLQLFSGMILKMIEDAREGHPMDGVYDQLSWMVLIVGLALLFLEPTRKVGMVMAIVGALVILFTAGRDKPTFVGKAVGGLMGLYNITSYLSDILSYSRILALGLATSVVGMVMNMLAGMVATNIIGYIFAALIFILGHVFNIVLSMLSAYVHDSRLQYIEFFNKFYEGGGLPFKPLEVDQRYIDVTGADLSQGSNAVIGDLQ